jgi:hypothetical protein
MAANATTSTGSRSDVADRFDNLSVDQLRQADLDARLEADAVEKALCARLEAACPVQVDVVYRVKPLPRDGGDSIGAVAAYLLDYGGRLEGRQVKVTHIRAQRRGWSRDNPVKLLVSVRPKLVGQKHTPTADGFGRKHHWIDPERLEPVDG